MSGLFRQQAIEAKKDSAYGRLHAINIIRSNTIVFFVFIFFSLLIYSLTFIDFSKKETAHGVISSNKGNIKVIGLQGGVVSKIFVEEGDQVREGQPLFSVMKTRLNNKNRTNHQSLKTQIANLESLAAKEAKLKEEAFTQQIKLLVSEKNRLKQSTDQIQSLLNSAHKRSEILSNKDKRLLSLINSKVITALVYEDFKLEEMDHQDKILVLKNELIELQSQYHATDAAISALKIEYDSKLLEIEKNLELLVQARTNENEKNEYTIPAPTSGDVTFIQAISGQEIKGEYPLLTIIPSEQKFEAHVFVTSRSISSLRLGQEVEMTLDAFPYLKFGVLTGKVHSISRAALDPKEVLVHTQLKESSYRIIIKLNNNNNFDLQSGMSVRAEFILHKATLFERFVQLILKKDF